MECERFEEFLSAYLDGEVDSGEKTRVEAHLKSCPKCSRQLADLKEIRAMLQSLKPLPAPLTLKTRVENAIGREKVVPMSALRQAPRSFARMLAGAAAAALIFVSSVTLLGAFTAEPGSAAESGAYLGCHAYQLMRQPLADHSGWSFVAEESNYEVLSSEE